jgi:hypothetical protein
MLHVAHRQLCALAGESVGGAGSGRKVGESYRAGANAVVGVDADQHRPDLPCPLDRLAVAAERFRHPVEAASSGRPGLSILKPSATRPQLEGHGVVR